MFPRRIYIVWFQGLANLTRQSFITNLQSWKLLNPDWTVICLDDTSLRKQCRMYSKAAERTYTSFPTMHQKIDFGRFVTLYNQGGIYVDMDAYAFRPLMFNRHIRGLIEEHETSGAHVLGLSSAPVSRFESYIVSRGQSSHFINNAVMMGSKNHPDLGDLINHIVNIVVRNPNAALQETTGPLIFGQFFQSRITGGGSSRKLTIFSPKVFEPCTIDGSCRIDDETVAVHRFELSWMSGLSKQLATFYVRHSELILGIAFLAVIIYVFRIQVKLQ